MKKRGLSTIITSLIIVLLVLVAVGVVWVAIKNIITEGVKDISIDPFTIDLDIEQAVVNGDNLEISIKRNPGKGDLGKIKLILDTSDGEKIEEVETSLEELGTENFQISGYSGINVYKVSILPVVKTEDNEIIGGVVDEYKVGDILCGNGFIEGDEVCDDGLNDGSYNGCNADCTLGPRCGDGIWDDPASVPGSSEECDGTSGCDSSCNIDWNFLNLISYWSFDNAGTPWQDDFDGNPGTPSGLVWNSIAGYGGSGAYDFDGDGYISIANEPNFDLFNELTISAWINSNLNNDAGSIIVDKAVYNLQLTNADTASPKLLSRFNNGAWATLTSAATLSHGVWTHVAVTWDGSTARFYINAVEDANTVAVSSPLVDSWDENVWIGRYQYASAGCGSVSCTDFEGNIDNVRIYNKALTQEQIQMIYNFES